MPIPAASSGSTAPYHHQLGHNGHLHHGHHPGSLAGTPNGNVYTNSSSAAHTENGTPEAGSSHDSDHGTAGAATPKSSYKRFRNSFIFFVNEQRKLRKPGDENIKNREFIQSMSEIWRTMSDDEKKPYIEMAKQDKERYESDVKKYGRLAVKKKSNKPSSPSVSAIPHGLNGPMSGKHGAMPQVMSPHGYIGGGSSVPVTPDWRQHQLGMMLGGAGPQSAHPSPHPAQQQQQQQQQQNPAHLQYMMHPQFNFNLGNGSGVLSPQAMAQA
ncbi:hypothetical protein EV182_007134, partial [Spiromyces aspiralis]